MTRDENLWSEQDLAALKRFRILVVLVVAVGISVAWAWTATHTSHHAELHAALPSPAAADQPMDQILKQGQVVRGSIGVFVQPVTPAIAKAFELDENRGALVGDVAEETPAERAGIERGDLIVELDGEPVEDSRDLQLEIAQAEPGSEVRLHILRDGRERDLTVVLDEPPSDLAADGMSASPREAPEGITVQTLTPEIARQLDLSEDTRGVVVAAVAPASPWSEAGLRRGDVIEEVDREPVTEARAFDLVLRSAGDKPLLLLVNRGGNTLFVPVELD